MSSSEILPHNHILHTSRPQKIHPGSRTNFLTCHTKENEHQMLFRFVSVSVLFCFVLNQQPKMSFKIWSFPKETGKDMGPRRHVALTGAQTHEPALGWTRQQPPTAARRPPRGVSRLRIAEPGAHPARLSDLAPPLHPTATFFCPKSLRGNGNLGGLGLLLGKRTPLSLRGPATVPDCCP